LFGVPEKGEYGPISTLYMIAIILPSISIAVRRLHDTNHSGWWILINMIPLVGGFWFLWLMCKDSDHETNRFGDDPTTGDMADENMEGKDECNGKQQTN
ncbi:MAG: DUF805 domain-containing protein, partial [Negativicutes bacterium]|nr:DUF805 domain-containing protein [Negativicutes bacterium]